MAHHLTQNTTLHQRILIGVCLWVCLAALYMISYSGQLEIADQLQYYNATWSTARFGDTAQDVSLWQRPPVSFPRQAPFPMRDTMVEPVMILTAAPLFLLADHTTGLGLVHTTWLYNVLVCALLGVVVYAYALTLGYRLRTAVVAALAFGLLTIVLPYSQTFFREPLMMVFLTLAALVLHHRVTPVRLVTGGALFVLALATKEAAILGLIGWLALLLPDRFWRARIVRRLSWVGIIAALTITALFSFTPLFDTLMNFVPEFVLGAFRLEPDSTRTALHTYVFSIGGSLFGTSPILLLAPIGAWMLLRQGEGHRRVWLALLMTFGFVYGYGLFRGEEWFGGTIWPQRFLLPALPFLMLLCLPALDALLHPEKLPFSASGRRLARGAALLLALYSAWWQFSGILFRWEAYSRATFDLSFGGLAYWGEGFNVFQYIRPLVLMGEIGREPANIAWMRVGVWWVPVIFAGVALLAWWVMRRLQGFGWMRVRRWVILLLVLFVAATGVTLRAYYENDPAYMAQNEDLHTLNRIIRDSVRAGDAVLLNDPEYVDFFYNYGKYDGVRVVTLPYHPGDRGSCDQELSIQSDNPAKLIDPFSAPLVRRLSQRHERLWLVMSKSMEIPCVVRPFEHFMGLKYYRITEEKVSPLARLIAYDPVAAPRPKKLQELKQPLDLRFSSDTGGSIELTGYYLPEGETYSAGDALPISLFWETDETPTQEFTVAWFLASEASGVIKEGENSWPEATFEATSTFTPFETVLDNRALVIPPSLPAGTYRIWVRLYTINPQTGGIELLRIEGGSPAAEAQILRDPVGGDIAVLPVMIRVE